MVKWPYSGLQICVHQTWLRSGGKHKYGEWSEYETDILEQGRITFALAKSNQRPRVMYCFYRYRCVPSTYKITASTVIFDSLISKESNLLFVYTPAFQEVKSLSYEDGGDKSKRQDATPLVF